MIIFARYPLFLAIAAIVMVLIGFYGHTKHRTLAAMAMAAAVVGLVVIDAFVTHLNGTLMIVGVLAASAVCLVSRKR